MLYDADALAIIERELPSASDLSIASEIVQGSAVGHRVNLKYVIDSGEHISEVFVKRSLASRYSNKSWLDLKRSLMYIRTEVRFYKEIVPLLKDKGFDSVPRVFAAGYDLAGLVSEDETAWSVSNDDDIDQNFIKDSHGGYLVMESISDKDYYQDSPLSIEESKQCLTVFARLHVAAWEDPAILKLVDKRLSRASYHLKIRNPIELGNMEESWANFKRNFEKFDPELFSQCGNMGLRISKLADYISQEISANPGDKFATLVHGDSKSMNVFLPRDGTKGNAILVDFASIGVGMGMSDVAMHIHHAVDPETLANGGETELLDHYISTVQGLLNDGTYTKEVALRQYRLGIADYFRFFLGRFWKSSTEETFKKNAVSRNINMINRSTQAALAFLRRADDCVGLIEKEVSKA